MPLTLPVLPDLRCILLTQPALCNQCGMHQLLSSPIPPPLSLSNPQKEFGHQCLGSEGLGLARPCLPLSECGLIELAEKGLWKRWF